MSKYPRYLTRVDMLSYAVCWASDVARCRPLFLTSEDIMSQVIVKGKTIGLTNHGYTAISPVSQLCSLEALGSNYLLHHAPS